MPFQIGGVSLHNDDQHTGNAKRDAALGLAGLDATGNILAPGPNLQLTRDGTNNILILDRTSGETAMFLTRTGAVAFTPYCKRGGVSKQMLTSEMHFAAFADVTGSRAINTVYQNTSGHLMLVNVALSGVNTILAYSDAANPPTVEVAYTFPANTVYSNLIFLVQPGNYYKLQNVDTIVKWYEWS